MMSGDTKNFLYFLVGLILVENKHYRLPLSLKQKSFKLHHPKCGGCGAKEFEIIHKHTKKTYFFLQK